MSDATHPLWSQAVDPATVVSPDIHPLWGDTPKSVIITPPKEDADSRFASGVKEQFNPAAIALGLGAKVAPLAASAVGFGLANRGAFQDPEQHQALADRFKKAHDDTADAIKKGDYLGAARIAQDMLLGEGAKEPVDMIEDRISNHDYAGAAGSALSALGQLALGAGLGKLTDMAGGFINKLRTPDPDLSLLHAAKPHAADTDFIDNIPQVRANVKRGEQITQTPITDVPSAIQATTAAMKEKMDALDSDKAQTSLRGDTMSTAKLKANAIKSLPPGLEDARPEEYNRVLDEINKMFPGKDSLNTNEVFDQSHLVNGELHRFFAAPDAAQRSKLVTNSGDTGILTSMAGDFSQWIKDHVGPLAAENNADWGKMNQFRTYLQAKTNPASLEKPVTNLESLFGKVGLTPGDKPALSSIAGGVVNKAVGRPTTIDGWIKAAFDQTEPSPPPLVKNVHQYNNPGDTTKQLPAGAVITPTPEDTSYVRGVPAVPNPPTTTKALPPASTRFQGDISPGSGVSAAEDHTLPTLPDGTRLTVLNAAKGIARDPKTGKFFKYYTSGEAPTPIKTLKLQDLQ